MNGRVERSDAETGPAGPSSTAPVRRLNRAIRWLWLLLGLFCVALGIIGAFLPLMPTTIFMILAAGCFARSSPRLENWLLSHHRFGPMLRAWRAEGAIPPRAKAMACTGIAIGYLGFLWVAHPHLPLGAGVAFIMGMIALYIVTRPAPALNAE